MTWQQTVIMWGEVVALFALSVFVVWGSWGGFPAVGSFLQPLLDRFYTPGIELVLFGPAITASAVSVWLINRSHRRCNQTVPLRIWLIVSTLALLAVYFGGYVAFNSFGT